jgi:hypothetical protein
MVVQNEEHIKSKNNIIIPMSLEHKKEFQIKHHQISNQ